MFGIAPDNVRQSLNQDEPDVFRPREHVLAGLRWRFPAGRASAVELNCEPREGRGLAL